MTQVRERMMAGALSLKSQEELVPNAPMKALNSASKSIST